MFIEVRLECSRSIQRVWLLRGALQTCRLSVESKDGFLLVDEGEGGRLPQECSRDHGNGDLGMANSLRGLVPRVHCCWWRHATGGRALAKAS